ncbi:MAG: SEC-C metal-binding domain-containing protein [Candidatus Margulisiibacteriota bacterium]
MKDPLTGKIKDGGKCVCDVCGKTGRLGGLLDPNTANPLVACYDCMIKISAKEQGISVAAAKKRREKMFKTSHLFTKIKMDEFFDMAGENSSGNLDELNEVVRYVMNVWNAFGKETIEKFDALDERALRGIFSRVKMNFSHLIKRAKVGRNAHCPCGSGQKYKKCCFIRDDLEEGLVAEWKRIDSSVIRRGMHLINNSPALDTKLLLEHYWGERRLDLIREQGVVDGAAELEFNEWLMNDYYKMGEDAPYILGRLLADETLSDQEKRVVEARLRAPVSVWLVTYIKKGRGALIRNIFDQEELFVHDRLFSESAIDGFLACFRVFRVGTYNLLSGAYRAYPGRCSQDVREMLDEERIKNKSSEEMNVFLRRHGYVFGRLWAKINEKIGQSK